MTRERGANLMYSDSFYAYRTGGWHHLGRVSTTPELASEAYAQQGPWPVIKTPLLWRPDPAGPVHDSPAYGIVMLANRCTPKDRYMATVSGRYTLFPYEQAVEILDRTIGKHIDTLGLLDDGMMFVTYNLPDIAVRRDEILRRFVVSIPIDGKTSASAFETDERVVCRNTFNRARRSAHDMFKMPHYSNIAEAFESWCVNLYERYIESDALKEVLEILAAHRIAAGQGPTVLSTVYPDVPRIDQAILDSLDREERDRRIEAYELRQMQVVALRDEAKALYLGKGRGIIESEATRGTAYGLFQSVVELENYRKGRGGERAVATSVVFGDRADTISRAFEACLALTKN